MARPNVSLLRLHQFKVYLEIFKWVRDDFGITVDVHPMCLKQKLDEKPPISPPKAKRSHDFTMLQHGKCEKVVRKSGDWDNIKGEETGWFDNLKNNKGKEEGRGEEGMKEWKERNKEGKKVKKVKEKMNETWEKSYEDAMMQKIDWEERDDTEEGKGKEREDAGISGCVTRRDAIKSGKYLNAYYIYIYIIHLYLVPPEPDVILNDDFTLSEEVPIDKQSLDQPGDNIKMESE